MILRPDYRAHAKFIAPARPSAALWRLLVGLVFFGTAYIALNQLFFQTLYEISGDGADALYDALLLGSTPGTVLLLLGSFAFMTTAVGVTVRLVHRRTVRSLLGPLQLAVPQFFAVLFLLCVLSLALFVLPPWDLGGDYVPNLSLSLWLVLLPASLTALLVQVSAEEILFRGYIQQQLAARFRSPLIWLLVPSGLFALGHYMPETAGDNAVLIVIWAGLFGLVAADLTARSGTLGPAIAIHLWQNTFAIVLVGMPDNMGGLALYHAPFAMSDTQIVREWLPVDLMLIGVTWLTARLALRR